MLFPKALRQHPVPSLAQLLWPKLVTFLREPLLPLSKISVVVSLWNPVIPALRSRNFRIA
jgi:hypothetical protein